MKLTWASTMARRLGDVDLGGLVIRVASLQDIVRSKEAAGRDADRRALPVLRELIAEQLRAKRSR